MTQIKTGGGAKGLQYSPLVAVVARARMKTRVITLSGVGMLLWNQRVTLMLLLNQGVTLLLGMLLLNQGMTRRLEVALQRLDKLKLQKK